MQKGQIGVIEDFEEFIPFDFFQIVFRLAEVNPQDSAFAALGADHCRSSVTLLCPSADIVMICALHRLTPSLLHILWLNPVFSMLQWRATQHTDTATPGLNNFHPDTSPISLSVPHPTIKHTLYPTP